jgi:hypothetical protein
MINTELAEKLNNFLSREDTVVFAYLFGSQVSGKIGKLSDIDVAVYVDLTKTIQNYFDLRLRLWGELIDFLKTDKLDLIVLNNAPPLLAHRILKQGNLLVCKNKRIRIAYEVKAILGYLDWQPFLKRQVDSTLTMEH